jgi:drug/metabolite transporter (DMT)-like permease
MHQTRLGILATLLAVSLLAGNGYFAKGLVSDTLTLTLIRSLVAAIFIFLVIQLQGKSIRLKSKRDIYISCVTGIFLGAHWISFFYSMSISTVTLGMITLYTYPIITLWLEVFILGKKAYLLDWITSAVVILGIYVMAIKTSETQFENTFAISIGLFSALCFAIRNILQQHFLSTYPAHTTIFYQTLTISVLMTLIFGVYIESNMSLNLIVDEGMHWLLLGIIFTALPHSLMAVGIRNLGAKTAAVIACMQPAIAAFYAYIFLDEMASRNVIFGALIILSAVFFETIFHKKTIKA